MMRGHLPANETQIFMMKEECGNVINVMNVEMPRRGDGTQIVMIVMMKNDLPGVQPCRGAIK